MAGPQIQPAVLPFLNEFQLQPVPAPIDVRGPGLVVNSGGVMLRPSKVANLPPCVIAEGGYQEQADRENGIVVTCDYWVPWTVRRAWVNYMIGYADTTLNLTQPPFFPFPGPAFQGQGRAQGAGGGGGAGPGAGAAGGGGGGAGPLPTGSGSLETADTNFGKGGGGYYNGIVQTTPSNGLTFTPISAAPPMLNAPPLPAAPALLLRVIPYQCPEPGWEHLYCTDVRVREFAGAVFQTPFSYCRDNAGNPVFQVDNNGQVIEPTVQFLADWPMWLETGESQPDGMRDGWVRYSATFRDISGMIIRTDEETATMTQLPEYQGVPPEMQRYVIRKRKQALQAQPLPLGTFIFKDTGEKLPENANYQLVPTAECTWIWEDLPDPTWATANALQGCVNGNVFDGARGFSSSQPETLLLQAPQIEEVGRFVTGRKRWRATYTALYRPMTWNMLLDSKGVLRRVVNSKTGNPIYTLANFNGLFVPPQAVQYQ